MGKQRFKKSIIIAIITVAVLVVVYISIRKIADINLKNQGNEIVLKVESFKDQYRRLPVNLREMGLPESEEGPIYYDKKKDDINYTVSFAGSSLGESTYYDSEDRLWHDF